MKINKDSTYAERLEYAEIAKLKAEYSELGYNAIEEYQIPGSSKNIYCDLYLENEKTGDKIIFEIKSRKADINNDTIRSLVQRRKEISALLPGVQFYVHIIEQTRKKENYFFGIESLLTFLFRFRHSKNLKEQIANDFRLSSFKSINISNINLRREDCELYGFADAEVIYTIKDQDLKTEVRDILPFRFEIRIVGYPYMWEHDPIWFKLESSDKSEDWLDKRVKSKFYFDLEDYE